MTFQGLSKVLLQSILLFTITSAISITSHGHIHLITRACKSIAMTAVTKGQVLGIWWTKKVVLNESPFLKSPPLNENETIIAVEEISKMKPPLITQIRFSMLSLKGDFMDASGSTVRYDLIKESPKFLEYLELVQKLKYVDMNSMDKNERKAFLINIYNTLVIHSLVEGLLRSFPGGSLSRLQVNTYYSK